MQYNRPIDSHGFQFISTASDHENISIGNLAADITLAISMESIGAGLMGRQGLGKSGRPLLGMIPGIMPASFEKGAGRTALETIMGKNRYMGGPFLGGTNPGALLSPSPAAVPWAHVKNERQLIQQYNKTATHPAWKDAVKPRDIAKMGFGLGLRSLSSAWLINDMFGLGFAAASGAIQGMSAFSYERRHREQPPELDLGEGFAQTRASFTQRQTAMAAIHNSQMNTRAAMGNEATFMHV